MLCNCIAQCLSADGDEGLRDKPPPLSTATVSYKLNDVPYACKAYFFQVFKTDTFINHFQGTCTLANFCLPLTTHTNLNAVVQTILILHTHKQQVHHLSSYSLKYLLE